MPITITELDVQNDRMSKYYKFHSNIYDLTRWSFLFGRNKVINKIPLHAKGEHRILEVGCGTGKNLVALAERFPNATIVGIDISAEMLEKASAATQNYKNIELLNTSFHFELLDEFDCILISYAMTMMNPGWEFWVSTSAALLKENGYLAVVDFNDSKFKWFKQHMSNHHVRMEGHILPVLQYEFNKMTYEVRSAYFGLWSYFTFIGKKGYEH